MDLLSAVEQEAEAYQPFLQSIALPISKEIRTVILRLIEGKEIRDLSFHYVSGRGSSLEILLSDEPEDRPIEAHYAWDPLILTQLGYFVTEEKLELGGIRSWPMPQESEL